jgi:surfactin synthase thioesterase subunit
MHQRLFGVATLLLGLLAGASLSARETPAASTPHGDSFRVYGSGGEVQGALVLLPGYGGDPDSFDPSSAFTPSSLPARLAKHGILTVVLVPASETLYETDAALHALDALLARVVQQYEVPRERVAIGGFSAGGTGAVRYAQRCAQQKCQAVPHIAAVFAVDPPLDFERLYRTSELIVQRNAPRSNIAEEGMILQTLRHAFGGTPDEARDSYRLHSAVLASAPDGGNALLLDRTPIRLYTEPDVHWWMDERNLDYHAMNVVDHAALINLLRVAGNIRAELITTTGKGYRPDGRRHPHSWSIVDEAELERWLLIALYPAI